jgi:hypothetical protein
MVGRVARSGRMSESARAWEGNAVSLGSGGDQRRSRLAGVAPQLEQVMRAQPTIGRFARSIWRACMRMNSSPPIDGPAPIPIQAPSPMSDSASTRLSGQKLARATSGPSPAAATQRHSGAVSVACARPTAMAATRGSGWPSPRHAHWTTSRRVRRSSPRQARTACLPRGTSTFASPITLRDSRPRPLPRTIPNLASPAAQPQSDRSFPQHAGTSLFLKPWFDTDAVTQSVTLSVWSRPILSTTGRNRAMQSGQSQIGNPAEGRAYAHVLR